MDVYRTVGPDDPRRIVGGPHIRGQGWPANPLPARRSVALTLPPRPAYLGKAPLLRRSPAPRPHRTRTRCTALFPIRPGVRMRGAVLPSLLLLAALPAA